MMFEELFISQIGELIDALRIRLLPVTVELLHKLYILLEYGKTYASPFLCCPGRHGRTRPPLIKFLSNGGFVDSTRCGLGGKVPQDDAYENHQKVSS